MIITIGGNLGAGKTTLAARLSKELGYDELYIGGIMREMAAEQNLTIEAFYERLRHNPELERSVDERQAKLMQEKDNLIVQGRVAWFFAKPSPFNVVNIFLAVAPEIGTQRTRQRAENADLTAAAMIRANTSRSNLEMQRYQALYHIENFLDPAHYDYTLDTSDLTENEVFEKVMAYLTVHKK